MRRTQRTFVCLSCLLVIGGTQACGGNQTLPAAAADADAGADASTLPTTKPDAATAALPSGKSWCDKTGPHDFCSDFDDSETGPWGWDELIQGVGNKPDVYGVAASNRSAPNGFHQQGVALASPPNGSDPYGPFSGAILSRELPLTKGSRAHLAFDVNVASSKDYVDLFEIGGRKDHEKSIAFTVWFEVGPSETSIVTGVSGTVPRLPPMPRDRWVHVDVDVYDGGDAAPGTVTVAYDGATIGTLPMTGKLASSEVTKLLIGVSRHAPSAAYEITYDNVAFDYR